MVASANRQVAHETRQFFPQNSNKGKSKMHQEKANDTIDYATSLMQSSFQKDYEYCNHFGAIVKIIHGDRPSMHAERVEMLREIRGSF